VYCHFYENWWNSTFTQHVAKLLRASSDEDLMLLRNLSRRGKEVGERREEGDRDLEGKRGAGIVEHCKELNKAEL
jgi:hypothetical protein